MLNHLACRNDDTHACPQLLGITTHKSLPSSSSAMQCCLSHSVRTHTVAITIIVSGHSCMNIPLMCVGACCAASTLHTSNSLRTNCGIAMFANQHSERLNSPSCVCVADMRALVAPSLCCGYASWFMVVLISCVRFRLFVLQRT